MHAVRIDSFGGRHWGNSLRAIHERRQSLMGIFQYREIGDEPLQLVCEEHVKSVIVDGSAASSASAASEFSPTRR